MTILVTGGAGFIGSNFIIEWIAATGEPAVNLDKLTYAGNMASLATLDSDPRHIFVHGGIEDSELVEQLLTVHRPRAILHFAAESHVDRSIHGPDDFLDTNVVGTFRLLRAATSYFQGLSGAEQAGFRFLHVSTDEVYGALKPDDTPFNETTAYAPNSPYSATKAASDHLVRAWHHTYCLPVLTTNCSNNYGPFQFPEKLIPLVIANAIAGKTLPIYGDGQQIRDWLYVIDHCTAIRRVLEAGQPGETYAVGGWNEWANIDIVRHICGLLDSLCPRSDRQSYAAQIAFVPDRPGHDRRYAIDASKIQRELGWKPADTFESGIRKTVEWYLGNGGWLAAVQDGSYRDWIGKHYGRNDSDAA